MRIYTIRHSDGAGHLDTSNSDWKVDDFPPQAPIINDWKPLKVKFVEANIGYETDLTQILSKVSSNVFSERAMTMVESNGFVTGEWLPVDTDDQTMWLLHLFTVIDCLDDQKIKVRKFKSGRTGAIEQHAFVKDRVPPTALFRAKNDLMNKIYCTDPFREFVMDCNLKGFLFYPVWDSNHEPYSNFPDREEIRKRPEVFGPDGFVKGFEGAWPDEWK